MADYIQDDSSLDEYYDDPSTDTTNSYGDVPTEEDIDWLYDLSQQEEIIEEMELDEPISKKRRLYMNSVKKNK